MFVTSGIKKTLFNNLGKNDLWACSICNIKNNITKEKNELVACKTQLAFCSKQID